MSKEKKHLQVKELKEISPLVDIYELKTWQKYMIVIKKPSIIGMDQSQALAIAKELMRICIKNKINAQILANVDFNDVKFFEVS